MTISPGPQEQPERDGARGSRLAGGTGMPGDVLVPGWVLLSLVFGLAALTGSAFVFCVVGIVVLIGWLIRTGSDIPGTGNGSPPGPSHRTGPWP